LKRSINRHSIDTQSTLNLKRLSVHSLGTGASAGVGGLCVCSGERSCFGTCMCDRI
jgi:hypothetical protein